jgi:coenzyme PQQ biosynthesis protein PqqD
MILDEDTIVAPKAGVRLRYDRVRQRHVLLAPERVLFPCPTTVDILEHIPPQGIRIKTLVDELAAAYDAPREVIAKDVVELLSGLARDRMLRVIREEPDVDIAA